MSDPWINSLVQSPLIRTLNSVPSKGNNFYYSIPDNIPPFSMDKVRILPNNAGASDGLQDTYRFRIPQNGYLNRMYLKFYVARANTSPTWAMTAAANTGVGMGGLMIDASGTVSGSGRIYGTGVLSSAWNAARILKEVTLQAHNKVLSRLYGDTIVAHCQRLPFEQRQMWGRLMRGFGSDVAPTTAITYRSTTNRHLHRRVPWAYNVNCGTPSAGSVLKRPNLDNPGLGAGAVAASGLTGGLEYTLDLDYTSGELDSSKNAVVYVPLPFSCLQSLAHNFQTRFVEDLELWVTKHTLSEIQNVIPGYASAMPELVCIYHTFHDSIENKIRNWNYKPGVPATIMSYDEVEETDVLYPANPDTADGSAKNTVTVNLRSNHLISEIILIHAGVGVSKTTATPEKAETNFIKINVATGTPVGTPGGCPGRSFGQRVTFGVGGATVTDSEIVPSYIELQGSGRVLWHSDAVEQAADAVPYHLQTEGPVTYETALEDTGSSFCYAASPFGSALIPFNNASDAVYIPTANCTQPVTVLGSGNSYNSTASPYAFTMNEWRDLQTKVLYDPISTIIRPTFSAIDSYHTGGIALQSLADPKLVIQFTGACSRDTAYIRCYVKYRCFIRVDSDTGIVTRTLDT